MQGFNQKRYENAEAEKVETNVGLACVIFDFINLLASRHWPPARRFEQLCVKTVQHRILCLHF